MENEILELLEKDSRISIKDMANMLGHSEKEISEKITELEKNNVICGYPTLINWDKTDKEGEFVTALIEVKVAPQREQGVDKIAKRLYGFDEVKNLYLMSGTYDLLIVVESKNIKEVSAFVSSKLATLDCILSTATHFVLKKYKDHSVILDEAKKSDERIIVSP